MVRYQLLSRFTGKILEADFNAGWDNISLTPSSLHLLSLSARTCATPGVCSTLSGKAMWPVTKAISFAIRAMFGHFGIRFSANVKAPTVSPRKERWVLPLRSWLPPCSQCDEQRQELPQLLPGVRSNSLTKDALIVCRDAGGKELRDGTVDAHPPTHPPG